MSLISIGLSGLYASSASMTTIGNNTANVDTKGYSRQQVMTAASAQQNIGVGFIGTGTTLSDVRRIYNSYLDSQLQTSTSLNSDATAYLGQASKIDSMLSDSATGLGGVLADFFTKLQTVSTKAGDSASRDTFLKSAQALSARFNSTSAQLKDQNASINTQLGAVAGQVNSLGSTIASLNGQITTARGTGTEPNSLLDARNEAVRQLNDLVGAKVVENNGSYEVSIGSGQPLVIGNTSNTVSASPSDADPSQYSLKLQTQQGSMDVTSVVTGGTIGGLLRYRSEVLQPAINQLGRLALVTSDQVNSQLNQGVDSNGDFGANLFNSINDPSLTSQRSIGAKGNSAGSGNLDVTIANTGSLTSNDYQVTFTSGTAYSIKRLPDGKAMGAYDTGTTPPPVIEGFSLKLSGGAVVAGDSFKVTPTRSGAESIKTVMNDTKTLAMAAPLTATAGASNKGSGQFTQPALSTQSNIYDSAATADMRNAISSSMPVRVVFGDVVGGAQSYKLVDASNNAVKDKSGNPITGSVVQNQANDISFDVGYTDSAGATQSYTFGMTISGSMTSGDTVAVDITGAGSSDNRNANATLALQTKQTVDTVNGNGTGMSISGANTSLISTVGAQAAQAKADSAATTAVVDQATSARDAVSGVSLDEEAANLIKYQQYYTASSQIIKAAQAIFSTLINSL
ncbi:flagellar hook-associated protein FlgK [Pseudomonas huanghezhanensis]|uniref:flagellar hook-associated protein FlgK n=1 Tax=Pseudomonas huanghezhanensis TaxID=3002903 RepID=UPI0022864788|nr:flagellar hook-associated protein FlgK [Pseudomonas sp. BSw22131]